MKTIVPSPARMASVVRRRGHVADLVIKVGNHLTTIGLLNEDIIHAPERDHLNTAIAALSQMLETLEPTPS